MSISDILNSIQETARKEAPLIATGIAVAATIASVALSAKSGMKAQEKLQAAADEHGISIEDIETKDKVKMTWKIYIPPTIAMVTSIAATVTLHKVGANRTASAMALYSLSESAFANYRKQTIAKIGEEGHKEIRQAVADENVKNNPPSKNLIITGNDVLCYDSYSGHYFNSSMEEIKACVNDFNMRVINNMYASLTDLYELLGIAPSTMSDSVGWCSDSILEIEFSSTIAEDGRPCLSVDFRNAPIVDFDRFN